MRIGDGVMSDAEPHASFVADAPPGVEVRGIVHSYGETRVLGGVDLSVARGEFITLLGPSGSGKTTLLRIIGGLVRPSAGSIVIDGRDVTTLAARDRGVGFVFQNYALFPHKSVFENVAFPLKVRKVPAGEVRRRVAEALELVELEGFDQRRPAQLSGGQQQRVALARALVFQPTLVLMDEPLGSLDKRLRDQLQSSIRILQRRIGFTTIYVTHDQDEAFALSDRIVVMHHGRILQIGRPEEIYRRPVEGFVARFVGDLNEFAGIVGMDRGSVVLEREGGTTLPLPALCAALEPGVEIVCGVRPERISIQREGGLIEGVITLVAFQGSYYRILVDIDAQTRMHVEMRASGIPPAEGDRIGLSWDAEETIVLRASPGTAR